MKAVVTGASGGIGAAVVQKFLSCGFEVVGIDLAPAVISDKNYTHLIADVTGDLPGIENVAVLVTAAGIQSEGFDAIDVNLKGVIRVVEKYAFNPHIRAVVNVASASARTGSEFPAYSASKGGVVTYTKNVALRLAPYGATANSLSPGGVMTSSNDPVIKDEKLFREALAESLLGKWAEPQEIAEWVYFLAAVNKSMTGEDILVDNGEALKSNFVWPK